MRQWLNRYATYSGSSPWSAPATLACIPYIEQQYGCWHVPGGLARLAEALARVAETLGVAVHTSAEVTKITSEDGQITGLTVAGDHHASEVVVANCDAELLYSKLFPHERSMRRTRAAGRSSSGFALLLGLKGNTAGLAHHNLFFSRDQRQEFRDIFEQSIPPRDPTIYVCASSVTDPTQAPPAHENWYVLVNVPAGAEIDWTEYQALLLDRLGVAGRVLVSEMITPADIERRHGAPGGAIYGTSSNGRRSAFLRATNRGPVRGLYLASGSAHPGGGLPLVAMSGDIAASLIEKDFPV